MADIDRVELLMRLAENVRIENNEWRVQVYREGQERYKRVKDLVDRFEREYAALDQELQALGQYAPRQQQKLANVTEPLAAGAKVTSVGQGGSGGRS